MDRADRPQEGETDLRALFLGVWSARMPAFVALIAVSLGYWGIWAVRQIGAPEFYSRIIQFNFPTITQGEYPNASPFRVADLIAPGVLTRVYETARLAERGIDKDTFAESFNIHAYIPDHHLILEKYRKAINRKGIASGEIAVLQNQMNEEIGLKKNNFARLSFMLRDEMDLNEQDINDLLLDVPRQWAKLAIKTYGSIYPAVTTYSVKLFDWERYETLDYLVAASLVQKNIGRMLKSIKNLADLPNGKTIRDKKTGTTLPDLEQSVTETANYHLAELSAPVRFLGIAKNREKAALYFRNELLRVERELRRRRAHAAVAQDTLNRYTRTASGSDVARQEPDSSGIAATPQLDGCFLDQLTRLIKNSEDKEYRQSLSDMILRYGTEAADIERNIDLKKLTVANLAKPAPDAEAAAKYAASFERGLPVILATLRTHVETLNRIHKESITFDGVLYETGGNDEMDIDGGPSVSNKDMLFYALLAIAAPFGTVVVVLTARWMRSRRGGLKTLISED